MCVCALDVLYDVSALNVVLCTVSFVIKSIPSLSSFDPFPFSILCDVLCCPEVLASP